MVINTRWSRHRWLVVMWPRFNTFSLITRRPLASSPPLTTSTVVPIEKQTQFQYLSTCWIDALSVIAYSGPFDSGLNCWQPAAIAWRGLPLTYYSSGPQTTGQVLLVVGSRKSEHDANFGTDPYSNWKSILVLSSGNNRQQQPATIFGGKYLSANVGIFLPITTRKSNVTAEREDAWSAFWLSISSFL